MIPVVKGWLTENAQVVASTALQVFGGMGYIEETGIAQQYRDVRITTIYEGTTGIQALDLVGRKLIRDMGASRDQGAQADRRVRARSSGQSDDARIKALAQPLADATKALGDSAQWIGMNAMGDLHKAFANSVPFLNFFGVVAGGWQLFRGAKVAAEKIAAGDSDPFYAAKIDTATFYAHNVLSQAAWLKKQITEGSADVMAGGDDIFDVERRALATAYDRARPHGKTTMNSNTERVKSADLGDGIRLLTLDNPPVNALGYATCAELVPLLEAADADPAVTTVIFTGANGMFSGGADVNDFSTPPTAATKTVRDVIEAVERSDKTFVAAIDGNALGGGFELALACDYRVATPAVARRPARDQARPVAGRGRHAAPAAPDRRERRAADDAQGRHGQGARRAQEGHPRRGRRRRCARRGEELRRQAEAPHLAAQGGARRREPRAVRDAVRRRAGAHDGAARRRTAGTPRTS